VPDKWEKVAAVLRIIGDKEPLPEANLRRFERGRRQYASVLLYRIFQRFRGG
jgi:hypothetical protein